MHEVTFTPEELAAAKEQLDAQKAAEQLKLQEDGNGLDNGAAAVVGVSVVLEIANVIFSHLDRCEADINKFIASIYGLKHEEVGELDPAVYLEMIVNIAEDEKFVDFIKVATKLFNKVK